MEADLIPYTAAARLNARAALVLAPHPDDEVFGCGGAIAAHVRDGVPVLVVVLTDGALHGDAAQRRSESEAAARALGCATPAFWQLPDRGLHYSDALAQRLADTIAQTGSDLLYAPSPWELHPDHRQAHALAVEAARRAGPGVRLALYEVGNPLRPNTLLDISALAAVKQAAMACFPSQQAHQDYQGQIQALNRYRTYTLPGDVSAAEAYWVGRPDELDQLLAGGTAALATAGQPGATPSSLDVPLVSIIVRSMDRATLAQALDSVALQTYPNIEVLVVAVTGQHQPLPTHCGRFPLRLLNPGTRLPRSQAANAGLDQARGDYLLLLDDDDWLMPGHIARLAQVLARQPHAWAAYSGISLVDAQGAPLGQVFDIPYDAVRQSAGNLTPIHAVLFSAQALAQGCRFDEALQHYEDWDFWLQLAQRGPFAHLPGVSGVYRIHDSSGVHVDAGPLGANAARIYSKWDSLWTPQRRAELMRRVWSHAEIAQQLGEARTLVAEHQAQAAAQSTAHAAAIAQQARLLAEQQQLLHAQHQQNIHQLQQLGGLQEALVAKDRHAAEQTAVIAQQRQDTLALLSSTSWRVTRPLRWLGSLLRRLKG